MKRVVGNLLFVLLLILLFILFARRSVGKTEAVQLEPGGSSDFKK